MARSMYSRRLAYPRRGDNGAMLIGAGSLLMLKDDSELIVVRPSGCALEQTRGQRHMGASAASSLRTRDNGRIDLVSTREF